MSSNHNHHQGYHHSQNGPPPSHDPAKAPALGSVLGKQRILYDGKRIRKAMTRRTLDATSSVIRAREVLRDPLSGLRLPCLAPTPHHIVNVNKNPLKSNLF